ncbi:MAG TPA: glycosyltransferase family 4 protein [Chloroflexota bacterium]|nr:glycosyltransferase family 4 protein [Chloroflexota bacterium]
MLRIAQLAPPFVSIPPPRYGGTERVVSLLTEELVRRGHHVTLFASGDSRTAADLVPVVPEALWEQRGIDPTLALFMALGACYGRAREFDVIHSHVDAAAFAPAALCATPSVHTLHGRLDLPLLGPLYTMYADTPVVSISHSQRRPLPHARWLATVYNGVDVAELRFNPAGGRALVFLGRISPEKGLDRAIRVARRAGAELVIAAREPLPLLDDPNVRRDHEYYEARVKPLLREPGIHFVGEVGDAEKASLLGEALALLNPIDWEEPFGLAMAEALACGTPVLATRRGSVPEVIEDGVTGWIGDDEDALVVAVSRVAELDRATCREAAVRRFSVAAMADGYEAAYARLLPATRDGHAPAAPAPRGDEWASIAGR